MTDVMQRLLERLQTGWQPMADEIDPSIRQQDLIDWNFADGQTSTADGWRSVGGYLCGHDLAGEFTIAGEVLWIDRWLDWAVTRQGFVWLYTAEEGAKMRWLGG